MHSVQRYLKATTLYLYSLSHNCHLACPEDTASLKKTAEFPASTEETRGSGGKLKSWVSEFILSDFEDSQVRGQIILNNENVTLFSLLLHYNILLYHDFKI